MKKFFFLIILLVLGFVVYGHIKGKDSSITASGIVISKEVNPYRIVFEVDESTDLNKEVEIEIKDQNLWNLIEEQRCYFVTYSSRDPLPAVLDYIEIRDDLADKQADSASNRGLQSYINYKLIQQALDS